MQGTDPEPVQKGGEWEKIVTAEKRLTDGALAV